MANEQQAVSLPCESNEPCLDSDLFKISQLIHDWREIAPALGLTQADEQVIFGYAPNSVPVQKLTMLRTWRQRHGPHSTYSRLASAFRLCGREDLVERVSELEDQREINMTNLSGEHAGMTIQSCTS